MTKAVGYVRVSTLQQVRDGDSLAAQREQLAAWAAYQRLPVTIEEDAGRSGADTENRPAFRRAVRAVLEAPGSTLVVKKLDRLGRNALDVQETLAVLLEAGVRVVALDDGVDSASGLGAMLLKLLTNILATFAELEKETIVARLQGGRRRAKEHRRAYSREAAYGLRRLPESKELVEAREERAAIARIRALRAKGLTIRAICAQLVAEGIRPRRGSAWSTSVVQRIAKGQREATKKKQSARIRRARAELLGEVA